MYIRFFMFVTVAYLQFASYWKALQNFPVSIGKILKNYEKLRQIIPENCKIMSYYAIFYQIAAKKLPILQEF